MTRTIADLENTSTTRFIFFGVPAFVRGLFSIDSYLEEFDGEETVAPLRDYLQGLCWILVARCGMLGLLVMVAPTFLLREVFELPRQGEIMLTVGFGVTMADVVAGLYLSILRLAARMIGVERAMNAYRLTILVWLLGGVISSYAIHLIGVT